MDDEKKTPAEGTPRPKAPGSPVGTEGLQSLWQSALGQIDEIRDVIVRGSQAGKAKLDVQLLRRQKSGLLADIGAAVLDEAKRGAMTLPASCEELKKRVDDIDAQIDAAEAEAQRAFKR